MERETSDVFSVGDPKQIRQETARSIFENQVLLRRWTLEGRRTLLWRQCIANPSYHISSPNLATWTLQLAATAKKLLKLIRAIHFDVSMPPPMLQTFTTTGSCVPGKSRHENTSQKPSLSRLC